MHDIDAGRRRERRAVADLNRETDLRSVQDCLAVKADHVDGCGFIGDEIAHGLGVQRGQLDLNGVESPRPLVALGDGQGIGEGASQFDPERA